ncbi:MAG: tetratricopeptide repeat-containing sensor histidine kinase [Flavobacteriaceae bacterium]|nr:tetratricopeptide repeat-containing sensor histidine kinase [Flavobacteriaceae bacterium]
MTQRLFFFFTLVFSCSFSQEDKDNFLLQEDIKKLNQESFVTFRKAYVFFFEKQKDSSFFYSSQAYNSIPEESEIIPYLDYIYGVNAIHKKFFTLAKKKLKNIPKSFNYQYLVNYNLGNIALNTKQYKTALDYYTSTLNSNKVQSKNRLKRIYHNIGVCYLHLKDYNLSGKFLLKELDISQNEKDTLSIIYSKLDLANLFYEQYKDNIAISYFKEAYQLATLFTDIKAKQVTAKNLAVVEKNRKRYRESTKYYEEYNRWKDSLWNRDKISQLLEKDKQIALLTKDKEIAVQKEVALKQKERIQLFIIVLISILLFLGVLFYLYRIKIKQNALINSQKDQLEHLNATKNYLFSVISHDLRSPTNSLVKQQNKLMNEITEHDFLNAEKTTLSSIRLVTGLQHLLNNTLNWALEESNKLIFDKKTWALTPIIQQVLIDFQNLAEIKQIEIQTNLNDEIDIVIDRESLKIILRNILDNAIKYTSEKGIIKISTQLINENTTRIEVKDSGKGISLQKLMKIKQLRELNIEQINRSKGVGLGFLLCTALTNKNNGVFNIDSIPGEGTTIKLDFPLH